MNFGLLIFLNANFYEKDGQPRCYASFVNAETGEVMQFQCHQWRAADAPQKFSVCEVRGQMRQYGRSVSFVLTGYDVVGKMVEEGLK